MKSLLALVVAAALAVFGVVLWAQQSPGEIAARVGDRTITVKELEDRWNASDPAEHAEALQKLYDGRRAALDAIVADMLITEAAKAAKMTPEAYTSAEVAKRAKKVTDAEVVSFYQANVSQMQGRSLDQMAPLINRFLIQQEEDAARRALVAELRKAGPAVRVTLEPPRSAIALQPTDPSLGNSNAVVTLVEFSDFQCPFCQRAAPTLKQLHEKYGDKIRIVWKDFPLTQIHPQAFKAAEAGHCAADQGKFWEYHDKLFAGQQALQPDSLKEYATGLGLDAEKFNGCLEASNHAERVRESVAAGTRLGVNSTPTMFINGRKMEGAQPFDALAAVIDEELARK
jgi:protein-disulfide isomerase